MSHPVHLVRQPTFAGLRPAVPSYVPADHDIAAELLALTGIAGEVDVRSGSAGPDGGFYRVSPELGRALFIKSVPTARVAELELADRMMAAVAAHGAPVLPPISGYPKPWGEDKAIFAYPFVTYRFVAATVDEVAVLGDTLGRLHRALASVAPQFRDPVTQRAAARQKFLEGVRGRLLAEACAVGPAPERLSEILALAQVWDDGPENDFGLVHGDMNFGNALYREDTHNPSIALVDFEGATQLWLPPEFDLAKAIERFCLCAEAADGADTYALGEAFLDAYSARSGWRGFAAPEQLLTLIGVQHAQPLCLLAAAALDGRPNDEDEWLKFFDLHDRLIDRRELVSALEERFARRGP